MYQSTLATIYTTPSGMCFAHLLSGADVAYIYFPPSLKSLWLNRFSEQVTEAAFFQEQHPFPQTIHLVDNPATPWTWANNVVKYFAALRRAVSRVPFCWNCTVPEAPRSARSLVNMQPQFQEVAFLTQSIRAVQALLGGILTTFNISILSLSS